MHALPIGPHLTFLAGERAGYRTRADRPPPPCNPQYLARRSRYSATSISATIEEFRPPRILTTSCPRHSPPCQQDAHGSRMCCIPLPYLLLAWQPHTHAVPSPAGAAEEERKRRELIEAEIAQLG